MNGLAPLERRQRPFGTISISIRQRGQCMEGVSNAGLSWSAFPQAHLNDSHPLFLRS